MIRAAPACLYACLKFHLQWEGALIWRSLGYRANGTIIAAAKDAIKSPHLLLLFIKQEINHWLKEAVLHVGHPVHLPGLLFRSPFFALKMTQTFVIMIPSHRRNHLLWAGSACPTCKMCSCYLWLVAKTKLEFDYWTLRHASDSCLFFSVVGFFFSIVVFAFSFKQCCCFCRYF